LCIFASVARVDKVLGSSNFGNMLGVVSNSRTANPSWKSEVGIFENFVYFCSLIKNANG
jgi:hypothetical protein